MAALATEAAVSAAPPSAINVVAAPLAADVGACNEFAEQTAMS
jgi:hypothetical protein